MSNAVCRSRIDQSFMAGEDGWYVEVVYMLYPNFCQKGIAVFLFNL